MNLPVLLSIVSFAGAFVAAACGFMIYLFSRQVTHALQAGQWLIIGTIFFAAGVISAAVLATARPHEKKSQQ